MNALAPPLLGYARDEATLLRVRERLFIDATLDDLESVLGEYCELNADEIASLEPRLYQALHQLFTMAGHVKPHPKSGMIAFAAQLLAQPLPTDALDALGHLRRVAVVVQELLP